MPQKNITKYNRLIRELSNRFCVVETTRTYRLQYNRRKQLPVETPEKFAAELKRLYNKAYRKRDFKSRQDDLLQKFLLGLNDHETRIYIELHREPQTIEEAVQEVNFYREINAFQGIDSPNEDKLDGIRKISRNDVKQTQKSSGSVNSRSKVYFCYICDQPGHYARNCYRNPRRGSSIAKAKHWPIPDEVQN